MEFLGCVMRCVAIQWVGKINELHGDGMKKWRRQYKEKKCVQADV